jgi:hypothetical protein
MQRETGSESGNVLPFPGSLGRTYRFGEVVLTVYDGGGEDAARMEECLTAAHRRIEILLNSPEANGLSPYTDPTVPFRPHPFGPDDTA